MATHQFKVGDRVICNGYRGTVAKICEWSNSMIEVRLERGLVCVDAADGITVTRVWDGQTGRQRVGGTFGS